MGEGRSIGVPALFGLFLVLMGLAWAFADPPGAGPDEPAHYIKALGVGGGDLYGRRPGGPTEAQLRTFMKAGRSAEELARMKAFLGADASLGAAWRAQTTREFTVPAGLSYTAFGCG
jgi:hypothetical protein